MHKIEINKFIEDKWSSIERIIDFTIKNSEQYKYLTNAYTGNGFKAYISIANINLNYDDIKQQLLLEMLVEFEKKDEVNLSYVKKLCLSRLKNILKRYSLEMKKHAQKVDITELELEDFSASPEIFISDLITRYNIEKTLLLLEEPLEKEFLKIIAGNSGLAGYEKYAIRKNNKNESDDLCVAKKLGFDTAKRNKYRRIKKSVRATLLSVIKDYDHVA